MSDTTDLVAKGRRRWVREHGDVRTRAYDPAEVAGSGLERGAAEWARRAGNTSARDALANDDQRRDT
jgi:hypothetical protein